MVESPLRIDPTDSDFRSLREDNLLYVDKTARIVDFLAAGKYLLFTRPRRFGKSLLLSTIEAMYSGDLALFQDEGGRPGTGRVQRDSSVKNLPRCDMLHAHEAGYPLRLGILYC